MGGIHGFAEQIISEEVKQKKGLPASADAGHHLNQAIVSPRDKVVQVMISTNHHNRFFSKWIFFADDYSFVY